MFPIVGWSPGVIVDVDDVFVAGQGLGFVDVRLGAEQPVSDQRRPRRHAADANGVEPAAGRGAGHVHAVIVIFPFRVVVIIHPVPTQVGQDVFL
jgi:hypothetical protein